MTRTALQIAPGTVSDETTFSSPGRWASSNNVRYDKGIPQPIGGEELLLGDVLTGLCRNTFSWYDNRGIEFIAFGTHSKLYVFTEGALYDITPTDLPAGNPERVARDTIAGWGQGYWGYGPWGAGPLAADYARTWSLDQFGEWLVASPRGKGLYVWPLDTSTPATLVTEAPRSITRMLVTAQGQVLALGCNEEVSGEFNPRVIRGCDLVNIHDWTTSAGNNAFEHVLEAGGAIVSADILGSGQSSYIGVWTESTVSVGEYLGQPDQTYRFDTIDKTVGLVAPNARTVIGQTAYWLAPNLHFYAWAPGSAPVQLNCTIRTEFADNIDAWQIGKVASTPISSFNEVWWFYPDTRDTILRNLFLWSQDFENGAYTKTRCSVSPNVIAAPDGTMTADKLVEGATPPSSTHFMSQTVALAPGETYSYSIYVKAAERTRFRLDLRGGSESMLTSFNLSTQAITVAATVGWSSPTSSIQAIGDGWYRCTISGVNSAGLTSCSAQVWLLNAAGNMTYTGDDVSGLYLWGAQLEVGSAPTEYEHTTSLIAGSSAECSRYVALNTEAGTWFPGTMPRTAATDRPAAFPLFVDPDGQAWEQENGQIAGEWHIRSSGQYLLEGSQRWRADAIYPDFKDQSGVITVKLYTQDHPQATPVATAPYDLLPGREKRNFRIDGAIIAVEYSGSGSSGRLGKPAFDVTPTGKR